MSHHSLVLFGGSRNLSQSFAPFIAGIVAQVIGKGFKVHAGCCAGADALIIQAAIQHPGSLSVFAVGDKFGQGFWAGSSYHLVTVAAHLGESVTWLAGGAPRVPLRARLIKRSVAALAGCSAAVYFLAQPNSRGSLAVAGHAVAQGVQVFAFCCGFSGPPAPPTPKAGLRPKCAGSWQLASFSGQKCWQWLPAQSPLL